MIITNCRLESLEHGIIRLIGLNVPEIIAERTKNGQINLYYKINEVPLQNSFTLVDPSRAQETFKQLRRGSYGQEYRAGRIKDRDGSAEFHLRRQQLHD